MRLVPLDLELSRRRAPCREVVLLYLAAAKEATLFEISAATGIRPRRVVGILEGAPGEYSAALSLAAQGAARARDEAGARRYAITPAGERAAWEALE